MELIDTAGMLERTNLWSDGYFCCTIGNASQETIRGYIASQG